MSNDTYVYNLTRNSCSFSNRIITNSELFSYSGGLFDESRSSTLIEKVSSTSYGLETEGSVGTTNFSYGLDTFGLTSNFSYPAVPFLINPSLLNPTTCDPEFTNSLGLGPNSTLLNRLVSTQTIPSRVWSIFGGWNGLDSHNQSDGSLVLGGFDAAKVSHDNITVKYTTDPSDKYVAQNCYLVLSIKDIWLQMTNGSFQSLMSSVSSTLRYCISPKKGFISLDDDSWKAMLSSTGMEFTDRSRSPLSLYQYLVQAGSA